VRSRGGRKLRKRRKAAGFRYRPSIEAKNFMATQIIAEIASSYYELMALDKSDRHPEAKHRGPDERAGGRQAREAGGPGDRARVQRFEAEVLKNKSRLYDVEQEKIQTEKQDQTSWSSLPAGR